MRRAISGPIPAEMSDEDDARFQAMEEQADIDAAIEQRGGEERLSLRWSRDQVDLIRRVAAIYGIPYQTYLKSTCSGHTTHPARSQ